MRLLYPAFFIGLLPLISCDFKHKVSLDYKDDQLVLKMVASDETASAMTMHLDFKEKHQDVESVNRIKLSMVNQYQAKREEDFVAVGTEELGLRLDKGKLTTLHGQPVHDDSCMSLSVKAATPSTSLSTCISFDPDVNWFNAIEMNEQLWPMEKLNIEKRALTPLENAGQALAEPYFVNSKGLFLYYSPNMTAFYSIRKSHPSQRGQFCIYAERADPYYRTISENYLNLTTCKYANPRIAHMKSVEYFLGKPTDIPDTKMVEWPIWTTWAKYKADIDAKKLIEFAQGIIDHGFKNSSQLEIDDSWEICYGAGEVDTKRFPNMRGTIAQLRRMGFRSTMWVHPFVNKDCSPYYQRFLEKDMLIQNLTHNPGTSWWNSKSLQAAHFDFSKPEIADWYINRLHGLQKEIGVDSFKFDAGESSFAPQVPDLNCPDHEHPGCLTRRYVQAASLIGPMIEFRTGAQTQYIPNYIRMLDRNSEWTFNAGLPTLLTSTFALNIAGYPFVMPDMIGGNAYGDQVCTEEMFIRWTQANVFMPILQFSIEPWSYGKRAVDLTKHYVDLHYKYSGKIIEALRRAVRTGEPVNPPIWWIAPNDPIAHACNDEYLLGDDILVAPVLKEGATSRSVYLPQGHWRDEADPAHPTIVGPTFIGDYHAPLDVLPYFTKIL